MKKLLIILLLLCAAGAWGAKYSGVKTVKTSGGDYTSIYAFGNEAYQDTLSGDLTVLVTPPITEPALTYIEIYPDGHTLTIQSTVNHNFLMTSPAIVSHVNSFVIYFRLRNYGKFVCDGLHIRANATMVGGRSGIFNYLPIYSNIVIKNCLIDGLYKWDIGIDCQLNDCVEINNNIIVRCNKKGIVTTYGQTTVGYPALVVSNNSISLCDTGIQHVTTSSTGYFLNNIICGNTSVDFFGQQYAAGINNICSDFTGYDSMFQTGSTSRYGNPHSNLPLINKDSIWLSLDSSSSNFMRVKPAYANYGVKNNNANNKNFYYDVQSTASVGAGNDSVEYVGSAILDTLILATVPSYLLTVVIQKSVGSSINIYNKLCFTMTNGARLDHFIDTIYGDSAKYTIRSPHYLKIGDTIFARIRNSGGYGDIALDYNGIRIKPNASDSVWKWMNFNKYDHSIGDPNNYQAYPGVEYSIDRKRLYLTYRETYNNNNSHGYDSTANLVFKSFRVDTNSGRVRFDSLIDSNSLHFAANDVRDCNLNVFNINGVETIIRFFWISEQIGPLDSGLQGPYGSYVNYSTDSGKTWHDTIRIFGSHTIANRCTPKLLHDDSVIVVGHAPFNAGLCTTYVAKASKYNLNLWSYYIGTLCDSSQIECNIEELKTRGLFSGRCVMITRDVETGTGETRLSFSNDFGRTWSYPKLSSYHSFQRQIGHYPISVRRLQDSGTIVFFGGTGIQSTGSFYSATTDECGTYFRFPESWVNGDSTQYNRLYQSIAEWKNGKILVAFCNNTWSYGSDVLFKYIDLNGCMNYYDSSVAYGMRPRIESGRYVLDSMLGSTLYIPVNRKLTGGSDFISNNKDFIYGYGQKLWKSVDVDLTAKINTGIKHVGFFYDSTIYRGSGSFKIERYFPFNRFIGISPSVDSCFINNSDTSGTKISHGASDLNRYKIRVAWDTCKIIRNDTTILSRKVTTAYAKCFGIVFNDNSGRIDLSELKIYPTILNGNILNGSATYENFHIVSDTAITQTIAHDTVFWDSNGVAVTVTAGKTWTIG
ncbi:MAG: hypothetical protein EHM66_00295, partial [Deltaproteobacteria bacterium]